MQGDNQGQVVRWQVHPDGAEVRVMVYTAADRLIATAIMWLEPSLIEALYECLVNEQETARQASLF